MFGRHKLCREWRLYPRNRPFWLDEAEGRLRVDACLSHEIPYLRRPSAVGMGLCADDFTSLYDSGTISPNQQAFGDGLLSEHPLVSIPSAVSGHS